MDLKDKKIAIVYDRANKWGGAERVLLVLNEIFPHASLYTSVYDKKKSLWVKVFPEVVTSFLQNLPVLKNYHELMGWLTPLAYETFDFTDFDLVISVTSEAAKGVITKPPTKHICYCLTPTRYLWSGYQDYLNNPPSIFGWIPFYKTISKPLLKYTKSWDKIACFRPDVMIAISREVELRIKKYYNRGSKIIHPPIDINFFQKTKTTDKKLDKLKNKTDFYLLVGRMVPYKKVDLAIRTFNKLGYPLIVVGTGSEEKKLKKISNKNILFKSFVADEELVSYYQNAKALIMTQEEDFGLVSVEAQACGTPVIAYKKGGALDTVIDKETGIFFEEQTVDSLVDAVKRFDRMNFNEGKIVDNAKRFDKEIFKKKFLEELNNV